MSESASSQPEIAETFFTRTQGRLPEVQDGVEAKYNLSKNASVSFFISKPIYKIIINTHILYTDFFFLICWFTFFFFFAFVL